MLAWISKPCNSTSCSCPSLSPQRGPQIEFPRPLSPGESLQTWPMSPSLQPLHRDARPALQQVSTGASLPAPADTSMREGSVSHLPQAQGMRELCRAGTRPSRNQIWAASEPKITCQLPGKRGEPSVHRSRTCQEESHLHPSSGIMGGSTVFGAIQWITAEQQRKTASRLFWAAKQQTANTPRPRPPSGEELPCLGATESPGAAVPRSRDPCSVPPLLPQEAAAARAAGSPKNLQTCARWEGVLLPLVTPAAITQKRSPRLSRGEQRSEQAGEAVKKIQMCKQE